MVFALLFAVYAFVQPTVSPAQSHYYMPQNMQKIFSSLLGSPQFHNCSDLYDVGIRKNGVYKLTNGNLTYYTFCNFSNSTNGYNHPLNNCSDYFNNNGNFNGLFLDSSNKLNYCYNKQYPHSCLDYYKEGYTTNKYYIVWPYNKPLKVFCDMTDYGGGWTKVYGDGINLINPQIGIEFSSRNGTSYNENGKLSTFYVDSHNNYYIIYSGHYINTNSINIPYSQIMIKYDWSNREYCAYSDWSGLYLDNTRIDENSFLTGNLENLKIKCISEGNSILGEEGGATNVHIYVR